MSDTRLDLEERCEKCAHFHRLKHNFKKGIGFEESNCCDVLLHLPDSTDDTKPWVQEVSRLGMCEMFTEVNGLPSVTPQEPKFIAKSDGTIEQIKNCNDCIFRKEWEKIGKLLSVVLEKQTEQEPKTGHCRDCKWWKDSDGAFRRGIGAESKCPMNRIEVYEGNGYCFLFEPQESEET